jgi:hypothetical protein
MGPFFGYLCYITAATLYQLFLTANPEFPTHTQYNLTLSYIKKKRYPWPRMIPESMSHDDDDDDDNATYVLKKREQLYLLTSVTTK